MTIVLEYGLFVLFVWVFVEQGEFRCPWPRSCSR